MGGGHEMTTTIGIPHIMQPYPAIKGPAPRVPPLALHPPLSHGEPGRAAADPRIPTGPRPTFAATPLERLQAQRVVADPAALDRSAPVRSLSATPVAATTGAATTISVTIDTTRSGGTSGVGSDAADRLAPVPGFDAIQSDPAPVAPPDLDLRR